MMKHMMPLMKTLTFNVMYSLIFGIERGTNRDILVKFFEDMIIGTLSVPHGNLPFTRFSRCLKVSAKVKAMHNNGSYKRKMASIGTKQHFT